MDAHEIPDSIKWQEGLLLTPQHFQQMSLRHEALLQYNAAAIAPFYWGVRHPFEYDKTSLLSGVLRILDLEAVMPDGLVVSHRQRDKELQVDLNAHLNELKQRADGMPVYLVVPARETDSLTKGDLDRYYPFEGDPVADESTGEGELRITRLKPRLELLLTEKPSKNYVGFPLVKVTYKNETFVLTDFIPPTPMVPLLSPLGIMCTGVARRVREKAMYLAKQASSPSSGAGARLDLETRDRIRSLVAALPYFEALLNAGVSHPFQLYSHPFQLYLALCAMVGQVSVLGTGLVPPDFKPYDHNNLRFTFEQVIHFIFRTIDEGAASAYQLYPFHYAGDGVYELDFDAAWMNKRLILGIKGQTAMSERDVVEWGKACLIGSRTKLHSIQENRTLGATREQIERARDLVPPRGVVLFALRPEAEFVEPNEILQIFNKGVRGGALRPSEIVLYVKNTGNK
jgi:type VI secretion system protein ImpJ